MVQNSPILYHVGCVLEFQMLFKAIFGGWLVNILNVNPDEEIFGELGFDDESNFL